MIGLRTDGSSVNLDSGVKVGQKTDCVCALGDYWAGDGEPAEEENGEA